MPRQVADSGDGRPLGLPLVGGWSAPGFQTGTGPKPSKVRGSSGVGWGAPARLASLLACGPPPVRPSKRRSVFVNNNLGISPSQLGQVHAPPRSGGAAPPVPSSEAQRADSVVLTGGAGSSAEPVAATEASAAALLQQEYARRFPGASSEQCAELASLFGDRFPRYHQTSPSGQKSLFWIPPGAPDQPFGLYRLDCGHGSPQPALDRECAQTLLQPPRPLNPGERPHPRDRRTPSEPRSPTGRSGISPGNPESAAWP